ncbi:hypothetical protein MP638_004133 [Amoeboaphelidium occidentale]|nr:hypothetical protein MP638_004133 [Amoeboaphelidium occidentale]
MAFSRIGRLWSHIGRTNAKVWILLISVAIHFQLFFFEFGKSYSGQPGCSTGWGSLFTSKFQAVQGPGYIWKLGRSSPIYELYNNSVGPSESHSNDLKPFEYRFEQERGQCKFSCRCRHIYQKDKITCDIDQEQFYLKRHDQFICPQNFRNIADWVFRWDQQHHAEDFDVPAYDKIVDCLPYGAIIYVVGWHIDAFFADVYPLIKKPFILITGDCTIDFPHDRHLKYVSESDQKIIHWFAQNARHLHNSPEYRYSVIPTGINCHEHGDALYKLRHFFSQENLEPLNFFDGIDKYMEKNEIYSQTRKILQDVDLLQYSQFENLVAPVHRRLVDSWASNDFEDPLVRFPHAPYSSLAILNFDPSTDPTGGRKKLWDYACSVSNSSEWSEFSVCFGKDKGVSAYINSMSDIYLRNMKYNFWASPPGLGVDTHRTWEALYLGRIPIILSSRIDVLFQDLPVLIVKDWSELTTQKILSEYKRIMTKWAKGEFKFEKMYMSYWEHKILSLSAYRSDANLSSIQLHNNYRPRRCWSPRHFISDDLE